MKIGICTAIDNIQKMEAIGYDYIEPAVAAVAAMEEDAFDQAVSLVDASGITCEAFNVLFPGGIPLTGPEVAENAIRSYLEKAFARVSRLGGKVIVFGSGGARRVPEGWDRSEAWRQLVYAAGIVGDIAAKYGLTIAMEPLNTTETNILNSVLEGFAFVKEVDHPNIQLLADFYHMQMEKEDMAALVTAGPALRHLHIANSHGRVYPLSREEDLYGDFFKALKDVGYDARISVEAGTQDMDKDAPIALKLLQSMI